MIPTLLTGVALTGCQTQGWHATQVINKPAVEKAQIEIKRQLAIYMARAAIARSTPNQEPTWCGTGSIDFDIVSVKVDLLTTLDETGSFNAAGGYPTAATPIVGAKVSSAKTVTNTQQLTFTEYAVPDALQPVDLNDRALAAQDAPIADLVMAERNALIGATLRRLHVGPQPCFTMFDPEKAGDPAGQVVVGLKLATDRNGTLSIALGPLSIGGGGEIKNSFANTVTVTFKQFGLTKETYVAACPNDPQQACTFTPRPKPKPSAIKPALGHPQPPPAQPDLCDVGHGGFGLTSKAFGAPDPRLPVAPSEVAPCPPKRR